MNDLSLCEARGLVAFMIDGLTCQHELELGEDAVFGLNLTLQAVHRTLQRLDDEQAAAACRS
ncbi:MULTISPECIES: hypothetical protein [unclassified Saccharibacter]|uniref:hypothetical protein n=1 Tax=unclassified Saccharibacter TaxID=2648722 RepID=UPI001326CC3E|nr:MULTISPECIES: hypothetical protein [unclassified Saccharibacter]MXV35819.1 hypothetical protein [Saccharibacter sp. EH611]MXV57940.1 hypothetical protein [Saccharibacter sp. EH70]MXV66335.1 hypothetical protein [Saccharibacter sp. EH60]